MNLELKSSSLTNDIGAYSLVEVAHHPWELSRRLFKKKLNVSDATITRSLELALQNSWLSVKHNSRYGRGRREELLAVSDKFYFERNTLAGRVDQILSVVDKAVFTDALDGYTQSSAEDELQAKRAKAVYLGSCAVLAERYELTNMAAWFEGQSGWQALVETHDLATAWKRGVDNRRPVSAPVTIV